MSSFFGLLLILSLVAFVVGMVKPKLIMRWAPEGKQNRKWVALATIACMVVFSYLAGATMTPEEKAEQQAKQEQRLQEKEAKKQAEAEKKAAEEKAKAEKEAAEKQAAAEKKAAEEQAAAAANTPEAKIKSKVQEYVKENYANTTIDNITVNPDLGTEKDGDYVVLVRLTWNVSNRGKTSQEMLDMYSSDMAARMYKDLPDVQELAVFWTVPYLNNGSAKISFERGNGGMMYTDKVFDKNFK